MLSDLIPAIAVALAASSLVSAQTSTDCNPLKKGAISFFLDPFHRV